MEEVIEALFDILVIESFCASIDIRYITEHLKMKRAVRQKFSTLQVYTPHSVHSAFRLNRSNRDVIFYSSQL